MFLVHDFQGKSNILLYFSLHSNSMEMYFIHVGLDAFCYA